MKVSHVALKRARRGALHFPLTKRSLSQFSLAWSLPLLNALINNESSVAGQDPMNKRLKGHITRQVERVSFSDQLLCVQHSVYHCMIVSQREDRMSEEYQYLRRAILQWKYQRDFGTAPPCQMFAQIFAQGCSLQVFVWLQKQHITYIPNHDDDTNECRQHSVIRCAQHHAAATTTTEACRESFFLHHVRHEPRRLRT